MKNKTKENLTLASLVGITSLATILLTLPTVSAETEAVDTVTITVPSACSMSSTITTGNEHTATVDSGTYVDDIGETTLKTICNDSNGFSIYAIGYTNDEYGNTVLKSSLDTTSNVITGTATEGNTSNWAMKLTAVSNDYTPTILSDTNGSFSSYHIIPSTYTKVATIDSVTDATNGSNIKTTYAVYMNPTQPAGTYTGKVKYTLVHPASANAPTPPPAPLASCTIKVPGVTYMQDITSSNYSTVLSSMEKNAEYYLRDKRDETPYCVSRLDDGTADGTIWMTQNLRITGTISAELSNFTGEDVNVCEVDLTVGDSYDEARCHDSGNDTTGVWYNYASASAKTITGSSNATIATEDICPSNWHLPSYDANSTAGSVNSITNFSSATKTAFQPVTGGNYSSGSLSITGYGYWWTTVASSTYRRYSLSYIGSSLSTSHDSRRNGYYIRCVR